MAADQPEAEGTRRRSWRGKPLVAGIAGLALVAGGALGALAATSRQGGAPPPPPALSTTTVIRADMDTTASFNGTVGFGPDQSVSTTRTGTITQLPTSGSTVTRGQALYSIDDQPTVLLYGTSPLFRTLGPPHPGDAAVKLQSAQADLLSAEQALSLAENHNETAIGSQQDQLSLSDAQTAVTAAYNQLQTDQAALAAAEAACAATASTSPQPGTTPVGSNGKPAAGTGGGCGNQAADAATVSGDRTTLQSAQQSMEQTQLSVAAKQYVSPATLAQARAAVAEAQSTVNTDQADLQAASAPPMGPDVATVAANLAALGDLPPAEAGTSTWNGSLTEAVERMQRSLGLTVTGALGPGQVVIAAGPCRVSAVPAHVGASAPGPLLVLTGTSETVSFTGNGDLHPGQSVTITPAAGSPIEGHITSVAPDGAKLDVQAQPDDPGALPPAASVGVTVTTATRPDVLSVPVEALLALASGGYALQTPQGRLIPVATGLVSGDRVEVSGAGVRPGLLVVAAI